eukprot:scaffold3710_cov103-Cylindrotheca_fusiformis.AAC.1
MEIKYKEKWLPHVFPFPNPKPLLLSLLNRMMEHPTENKRRKECNSAKKESSLFCSEAKDQQSTFVQARTMVRSKWKCKQFLPPQFYSISKSAQSPFRVEENCLCQESTLRVAIVFGLPTAFHPLRAMYTPTGIAIVIVTLFV